MRKIFLFALIPFALRAQSISAGLIGGVPFTDAVNSVNQGTTSSLYKSSNFTVGPALQINLPVSLRFEVDALYRPSSFALVTPFGTTPIGANQWRFPFLLQYRFKQFPVVKPFVEGGASFDHLSNISAAANTITSGPGQLLQKSHGSVVLGGGVDFKVPFLRLSAELRYTHQGSEDFRNLGNLNQAEFLVGVHF